MENTQIIIQTISAIATSTAAICAALSVKNSTKSLKKLESQHNQSLKNAKENSRDHIFFQCLDFYLKIMSKESEAIQENKLSYAFDAQRGLIDLLWFEFSLYLADKISDEIFIKWLNARKRSYIENRPNLKFEENGLPQHFTSYAEKFKDKDTGKVVVSYKNVWDYLMEKDYFQKDDVFRKLISEVHDLNSNPVNIINELKSQRQKTMN